MFSNIKADIAQLDNGKTTIRGFIRGLLSQGFQAILVYRFFSWLNKKGLSAQPLRFCCERVIEMTTGISIPAACRIAKGLRIHHFGGIILHPSVTIGENCIMYHQVTIGDIGGTGNAARIGNNVMIGAGAKIIGEITIGDNCKIGANTVVNTDLPSNSIAFGNPARIKTQQHNGHTIR
jgi:serine O-acetyltransferase